MKFIQHLSAHSNPQFIYQEIKNLPETVSPVDAGAEGAEALAQLATVAELGNLSVQAIAEAYWNHTNRGNVLTQVNDAMGYVRGSGDRIKNFNDVLNRLATDTQLNRAFANALGIGNQPLELNTETTTVTTDPAAESATAHAPSVSLRPRPRPVPPLAQIENFETQEITVQPGDNFYRILGRFDFNQVQQDLIIQELTRQGAQPDRIYPGDVIKIEQDENRNFSVTLSRGETARNFTIAAPRVQPTIEGSAERVAFTLE